MDVDGVTWAGISETVTLKSKTITMVLRTSIRTWPALDIMGRRRGPSQRTSLGHQRLGQDAPPPRHLSLLFDIVIVLW